MRMPVFPLLVGLLAGIGLGIFFGELSIFFDQLAFAYFFLVEVCAVPLLICSACIGAIRLGFMETASLVKALSLPYVAVMALIGIGMLAISASTAPRDIPLAAVIEIESTQALSQGLRLPPAEDLALLFVGACTIICVSSFGLFGEVQSKESRLNKLEALNDTLFDMCSMLLKFAPLGIAAHWASIAGSFRPEHFQQQQLFASSMIISSVFFTLFAIPHFTSAFTKEGYFSVTRKLAEPIIAAILCGHALVALPVLIARLQEIFDPKNELEDMPELRVAVPLLASLPLAGSFMGALFVLSLLHDPSHLTSRTGLDFQEQLELLSLCFAMGLSPFADGIAQLKQLLGQLHLAPDHVASYVSLLPLTEVFSTAISVCSLASMAVLGTVLYRGSYVVSVKKLSSCAAITMSALCISLLLGHMSMTAPRHVFGSHSYLSLNSNLRAAVEAQVLSHMPELDENMAHADAFDRIMSRNTLRVGICAEVRPFAYHNQRGQLVGFDTSMAYELAHTLGVSLEFVPLDYSRLAKDLNDGRYDIAMSGVCKTKERAQTLSFGPQYLQSNVMLIVPKRFKERASSLKELLETEDLKIVSLDGSSFLEKARQALPPHIELIALSSYEKFLSVAAESQEPIALIWSYAEAQRWLEIHENFVSVDAREIFEPEVYAFAMSNRSPRLLAFIEEWQDLKTLDGTIAAHKDTWFDGKPSPDEPRWSILHNVLHQI